MARQRIRPEEDDDRESRESNKPRKGGSWTFWLGSRLLVVLLLLLVLAFFAPMLIGSTGAWKSIVASTAPKLADKLDAASVTLSWFAPIEMTGVAIRDAAGEPLAEVARVRSRKTLLEIALNYHDLGTFDIEEPKARLSLRAGGSNAEDFLALLPKSEGESPATQIGLAISRGQIQLDDTIAGRQWLLSDVTFDLLWTAAADQPKTGKLSAAVSPAAAAAANPAQIAAEFSWLPPTDGKGSLGAGQAQFMLSGVPAELTEGALRRFVGDIRPAGPLTLEGTYVWTQNGQSHQANIKKLSTPGVALSAPQWLGADQPRIAIRSGQGDVQLAQGKITARGVQLDSNWLQLAGTGTAVLSSLRESDLQFRGECDLAEVARQLPSLLRVKQGTQLSSGAIRFVLNQEEEGKAMGRTWNAALETNILRATIDGRPVAFLEPISLNLRVHETQASWGEAEIAGRAAFFNLAGRGTLAGGSLKADADLDKLIAELGQVLDVSGLKLSGKLNTDIQWKHDESIGWLAAADASVQNFAMQSAGLAPWQEPNLKLAAELRGAIGPRGLERIDAGRLSVVAGADQLAAELAEPVQSPSASTVWPLRFSLKGDLATWTPRIQPLVALGDWRLSGAIDAVGAGKFSPQSVELTPTGISIEPFALQGGGLSIREPRIKIDTAGAWDQQRATLTLGTTTFASSALAFRADGLRVVAGQEPSLVGVIDVRGDLAKLHGWLDAGNQARTSLLSGALTGRVEVGYRGQTLAAAWQTDVENFAMLVPQQPAGGGGSATLAAAASPQWQPLLPPEHVNLTGQGSYDPSAGTLKIERTALTASTLSLAAAGTVKSVTAAPQVDLSGEIAYDLERLTQQIQAFYAKRNASGVLVLPYGLNTLQLQGNERRQFVLKGPLFAATDAQSRDQWSRSGMPSTATIGRGFGIAEALTGEASLGWQGAQYVGLVSGAADCRARLAGGIINIGPLDIPVSEGRLTTAPRVLLNSPVPAVVVERGPLIQNVRISPEMCSLWLKFVAPLVAEATRAEGKFSLSLEGAAVPIADPVTSDVTGTLAIHQAQIGPGPLAQQYLGMAQQLRSFFDAKAGEAAAVDPNRGWLILPQQDVPFEVRQGVVHHHGLTMTVKDVVITTEGSVGIETQQINLLASIPVQESWLKNDAKFAFLKGQTIKVPIRGTLSQPQLDGKVLENLGKQLVGNVVQGQINKQVERGQELIQREFDKGLNRLFGPL
ncbi:MAG TPA: hypothetical protein VFB80_11680, partial [Pirellulaceae bacterium]|nr:hypothetical protein [Pirellulaceae bacterium]